MISSEENETLIITSMPSLIRLSESKILPFFVDYIINGTIELKNAFVSEAAAKLPKTISTTKTRIRNDINVLVFIFSLLVVCFYKDDLPDVPAL